MKQFAHRISELLALPSRLTLLFILLISVLGTTPGSTVLAAGAYIDAVNSPRISNLDPSVNLAAGLSNGTIALLSGSYSGATPSIQVVNPDGSEVYSLGLSSALGSRATNKQNLFMYPIANGELVITVEGTSIGCDNNSGNLFRFLRLDADGVVLTPLMSVSTSTNSFNCETSMARLSNGNLAFTYKTEADNYMLRIMQPNGTPVTAPTSVQKSGTGNGACSSANALSTTIAANLNGTFLVTYHCETDTNLYGTLYRNDGTQISVGADPHFVIGTHTGLPLQSTMGLSDNNFMVAHQGASGYMFHKITPSGTISSAGSYVGADGNPTFAALGDGGFVAIDYAITSDLLIDDYYDFGIRYANDGSEIEPLENLDTTYSEQCDFSVGSECLSNNDPNYMDIKPATTGYGKGVLYVNARTHDLVLHSFGPGPDAPIVTTNAANGLTATSASLNGTVNGNGGITTVNFEYGLTTAYGTVSASAPDQVAGSLDTAVSKSISGLIPNTTYHFRVIAVNLGGTTVGLDESFTTPYMAPTVSTLDATVVTSASATLNGSVNANNGTTAVTFEYGETTSYGTSVSATPAAASGMSSTPVTFALSGLVPNTTYHFRVVGVNPGGTSNGEDRTFTTNAIPPSATTDAASGVDSFVATLNATVNAHNASTAVTFEYGLTTGYGTTVTAALSPVTGTINTAVSKSLTGLAPNATYHYRVVAVSVGGITNGQDQTFDTLPAAPSAVTNPASGVTMSGATLNGSVNANNDNTAVTFEYGLTDSYGDTVTATQSPLADFSDTPVSAALSGLIANTTYHFRVVAVNATGTTTGSDMTFTTDEFALFLPLIQGPSN